MSNNIRLLEKDIENLREIYEQHKDEPNKVIEYKGREILIGYLKYVLEYADSLQDDNDE